MKWFITIIMLKHNATNSLPDWINLTSAETERINTIKGGNKSRSRKLKNFDSTILNLKICPKEINKIYLLTVIINTKKQEWTKRLAPWLSMLSLCPMNQHLTWVLALKSQLLHCWASSLLSNAPGKAADHGSSA